MTAPFDALTRLGTNFRERQRTLLEMRHDRLQFARQFMLRQLHCLGMDEYCDRKKFKTDHGDLMWLNFEIVPLPEAQSIKATVQALQHFVHNIEINISDATGDVTVRENDNAMPDSAVAQHRLVTKIDNLEVESNHVAFGEYYPATPGLQEQALMICDVVEEDKLFPYRHSERLRQDVITIISLVSHQGEDGKPIIVMARWLCQRILKSVIPVPQFAVNRIRDNAEKGPRPCSHAASTHPPCRALNVV